MPKSPIWKKRVRLIVWLGLALGACTGQSEGFSLQGTFDTCQADSLWIYQIRGFTPHKLMAAAVVSDESGYRVRWSGTLPAPGFYEVGQAPNNLKRIFLGTEQGLRLQGNCGDLRGNATLSQSPLNQAYQNLEERFLTQRRAIANLYQRLLAARMMKEQDPGRAQAYRVELDQLLAQRKALYDSVATHLPLLAPAFAPQLQPLYDPGDQEFGLQADKQFFAQHFLPAVNWQAENLAYYPQISDAFRSLVAKLFGLNADRSEGEALLDSILNDIPQGGILQQNILATIISALDDADSPSFIKYVQAYQAHFSVSKEAQAFFAGRIKAYEARLRLEKDLSLGATPPAIALPNPEGDTIRLRDFRGKMVLIDFWASWCGPCRQENPHLVNLYQTYQPKGLEILGVSLDRTRQAWLDAIEADGLPWPQVSDLRWVHSPVAQDYRVRAIPMNFLLDRSGKIIAKNLRGVELSRTLATLFSEA